VVADPVGRVPLDGVAAGITERRPRVQRARVVRHDRGDRVASLVVRELERSVDPLDDVGIRFGEHGRRQPGGHPDGVGVAHPRHSTRGVIG
jgi:hypothetical protein